MRYFLFFMLISIVTIAAATQHIKDPTKCIKVCFPPGYDGEWPEEFPDDVKKIMCEGDYCAKADHGHTPGEEDKLCKTHYSCTVHCSEVCCVCLRECV